eukprot:3941070-Rhodomonas_salina.2
MHPSRLVRAIDQIRVDLYGPHLGFRVRFELRFGGWVRNRGGSHAVQIGAYAPARLVPNKPNS